MIGDSDITLSGPRSPSLVSVVAPVYNEEGTVGEFHARV